MTKYVHNNIIAVLKAERISDGNMNKGYIFPDEDDDLASYTGRSTQLSLSSSLLQDLCK